LRISGSSGRRKKSDLNNMSPFVRRGDIIIWPWGQRSRSHEGHYSMRHTTLWSCTHILEWYYLKNNYLTSRSKVIMVRDTPPYGHSPTYQISMTYLERQKCYGPDKKILFKKQLFDIEVKGQGPPKVITQHTT
jgi:hypothetical protein